jgi:hypothetical protein
MHAYTVKFAGGADQTVLNPIVLLAMLVAIVLIFVLQRKYAIAPLLIAIFLVPQGQQLYIAGVHFYVSRLVILAAFIRATTSKEPKQKSLYVGGWNAIDTATICYISIVAVATVMQYVSVPAIVNQVGYLWDYILGYLAIRSLIRNEEDTVLAIQCLAALMMIFAVTMFIEQEKMLNVFGLLGGVARVPEIREGKIRCQGAFQHPLTAGSFAGTAIPLFVLLWKRRTARWLAVAGIVAATVMTITTQTSTSLLTEAAGILAICLWPLRKKMQFVRRGLVAGVIGLGLVMKAPVWFIIAHIDLTGSSSSYQRAELINEFVNHFSNWWLMGTTNSASWGWDMWDAQNMFVSVGEAGGLAALIFFILMVSRSFGRLGTARKRAKSKQQEWVMWLLGSAVFAHVVAFFGANYFDQVRVEWFAVLAMICACTAPLLRSSTSPPKVIVHMRVQEPGSLPEPAVSPNPSRPPWTYRLCAG